MIINYEFIRDSDCKMEYASRECNTVSDYEMFLYDLTEYYCVSIDTVRIKKEEEQA